MSKRSVSAPPTDYTIRPVGVIHSCFKERFGVPRQSGLVAAAKAELELLPPYDQADTVRGLEGFSHIWIEFIFHQREADSWSALVRPPRLGGNRKVGVFASRSPFRPNRLGLSLVRLDGIDTDNGVRLLLSGVDLLDGTPVVDIKPYLPYAEAHADARSGFVDGAPAGDLVIRYSADAERAINEREAAGHDDLRALIAGVLAQDPRPAYRAGEEGPVHGMLLHDFNLTWRHDDGGIEVLELAPVDGC